MNTVRILICNRTTVDNFPSVEKEKWPAVLKDSIARVEITNPEEFDEKREKLFEQFNPKKHQVIHVLLSFGNPMEIGTAQEAESWLREVISNPAPAPAPA